MSQERRVLISSDMEESDTEPPIQDNRLSKKIQRIIDHSMIYLSGEWFPIWLGLTFFIALIQLIWRVFS